MSVFLKIGRLSGLRTSDSACKLSGDYLQDLTVEEEVPKRRPRLVQMMENEAFKMSLRSTTKCFVVTDFSIARGTDGAAQETWRECISGPGTLGEAYGERK